MTTPIERAARSIHSTGCADELYGGACTHNPTNPYSRETLEAVLVFESIDREGLARLIAEVDISWHAMRGLDGQEQYDITLADAIIAHLTGDQS